MTFHNRHSLVAGDTVQDVLTGEYKHIRFIEWSSKMVYMTDGSVLSTFECGNVYQSSRDDCEAIFCFAN